jgi:LysR family transcriptional regulator, transcriptional activator of nhaA
MLSLYSKASTMQWLNYHHLLYFWVVAREGSISRACEELRLAQPTISGQLKSLEESLGEALFERKGRGLQLTEVGKTVYQYADRIFSLGQELQEVVRGFPKIRPLNVGIADVLPKHLAYKLLEPVRGLEEPFRLVCREGRPERLFADLALHNLDLVLTDTPIDSSFRIKAFSHLLGESTLSFFGSSKLALKYRRGFPKSLEGAPILIPSDESAMRHLLDQWLQGEGLKPLVVGEFSDMALLQIFGDAGDGMFPSPTVLEGSLKDQFGVQLIGEVDKLRQKFYLISAEKKVKHPAIVAIIEGAKRSF